MTTAASHSTTATPSALRRYRLMARSLAVFIVREVLAAVAGVVVAFAAWYALSLFYTSPWLPAPRRVASSTGELLSDSTFRSEFMISVGAALVGFVVAVVVGGVCGIAMAISRMANLALRHYVDLLLIVPSVALAPILVVMFGITWINVVVLTTLFAVSIIAITASSAVRDINESWVEVGQVMGATRGTTIRQIMIPAILPPFFGGLHLGITRAFKGMVVGQVFLGVIGIGGYLARFQQGFNSAGIWGIALLLIATALLLTWTVKAVDHVVNYWAYRV